MKYEYSQGAQIIFSPCDSHMSLKGASGNLECSTTFAELIKIYLLKKFHKFWLNRSRETPEKWDPFKKCHCKNEYIFVVFFISLFLWKIKTENFSCFFNLLAKPLAGEKQTHQKKIIENSALD